MAWACVMDEGQQADQKRTSVEANWEKINRTNKQKINSRVEKLNGGING